MKKDCSDCIHSTRARTPECHHPDNRTFRTCDAQRNGGGYDESLMRGAVCGKAGNWFDNGENAAISTDQKGKVMTTIAILRQLSAGHAAIAAALRQAADEAESGSTEAATAALNGGAAEKPKGKPGRKPKDPEPAATQVVEPDPLAGLMGAAEPAEEVEEEVNEEVDPLAGLIGSAEPEPEPEPVIDRKGLAKLLGEFSALVDGVRGKGSGSQALLAMFKKHGAADLKTLAEAEFLGVANEANAVIDAIKKMKS